MVGEVLSKYKILEEIGQGGMATVYRALDTSLNREVAVKVLHAHLASREESRERFQREAHAVARLRHRNILEIFDYSGKESEQNFIVMEFIHGPTLKEHLDSHKLDVPELGAMITVEVCNALVHAHATGIIHRDIKPENIMIRDDGVIKLTDFGIAAMVDTQKLTVTGQLLGSPAFMAPEMVTGDRLDFRTDVFSVGILLYALTVGELPFKGKNPHEVLKRIAEVDCIRPIIANPKVGDALSRIIDRAMERNPEYRYGSIEEMQTALEEYLAEQEVEDAGEELKDYFKEPDQYQRDFELVLIANLVDSGQSEMRRGNHAKAFSLLNRVLSFDPHNSEVKALLSRLNRRRGFKSLAKLVVLLGLIAAAAVAVAWGMRKLRGPDDNPFGAGMAPVADRGGWDAGGGRIRIGAGKDPDASAGMSWAPLDDGGAVHVIPDAAVMKHGMLPKPNGMRRVVVPKERVFRLAVRPATFIALLDGKQVSPVPGLPLTLTVGPGEHLVVLRDAKNHFQDIRVTVGKQSTGGTIGNSLRRWRPGRLRVTGSPPGALWRIESPRALAERFKHRRINTKSISIPFTSSDEPKTPDRTVELRIWQLGYRYQKRFVRLVPGTLENIKVDLTKN